MVDPMPATLVYRWITDLHSGQRLDLRPRALEAVQSWEHDRAERDEVLLRPLGLPSWRSRAAQGGRGRPIDDPLLASIVPFLRSQDFAVGVVLRDRATRLVARAAATCSSSTPCPVARADPIVPVPWGSSASTDGRSAAPTPTTASRCGAGSRSRRDPPPTRWPSSRTRRSSSPGVRAAGASR